MNQLPNVTASGAACVLILASSASAGTETWAFDLTTTGNDVFWTSPTTVDNSAFQYEAEYEITLIAVTGTWQGINVGPIDVTDEVPKEDLSSGGIVDGPPPIVLLDDSLVTPEPPEEPAVEADVLILLDQDGAGQVQVTNVTLGTTEVEIPFFGMQTVQITSIRVAGTMTVTPLEPKPSTGDLNGDGVVDVSDLLMLLGQWGQCNACEADLNGDGVVDVSDMLILLANWG